MPVIVASSPGYPSVGLTEVITGTGTTVGPESSLSSSHENITKVDNVIRVKTLMSLITIISFLSFIHVKLINIIVPQTFAVTVDSNRKN